MDARLDSTFASRADALFKATRALVQHGDIEQAADELLESVCTALAWDIGELWWREPAAERLTMISRWHLRDFASSPFVRQRALELERDVGLIGKVWHSGRAAWSQDIQSSSEFARADAAAASGLRSAFAFPIRLRSEVLGVIAFFTRESRVPDQNLIDMMDNLGSQIGLLTERSEAEAAMAESERRLRLAMDASGLGAWEWDIESGRVDWSNAIERIHGIPEGSFGGTFEDYIRDIHPDDLERVKETIARSLQDGSHEVTYRIIRPDGEVRWLSATGQVQRGLSGRPERLVGVCADITERKDARERRARLAAIVESSDDAIISKNLDGFITSWNRGAERTYGYTADEIIGRHISTILPEEGQRESAEILDRIRNGETIEHHETRRKGKDGRLIDVSVTISPIRDADGNIVGASAINRDITRAKRQQDCMMMMAQASSVLAAASPDVTMMMAAVGRLAVPTLADWCSVDLLESDGTIKCMAVIHDDPEKVQAVLNLRSQFSSLNIDSPSPLASVIRSGKTTVEYRLTSERLADLIRDESARQTVLDFAPTAAACVPIVSRGRTLGAMTFAMSESGREIDDESVSFAEELARRVGLALDNVSLVRQLEASIESKDEFLGLMSHELRTPITAIFGGARLLRSRGENFDAATREQLLKDIEEESERLFRMVENLLALSRVELGQRPPTEPVLAQRIIGKLVANHREKHPVRTIELEVPDDLPAVNAQTTYVEQILRNLLSNAEKYTPREARIMVSARSAGSEVEVKVCDEGQGIEPHEAEMLFERFYRTQEQEKRVRGLGLGLTVCRRLVEAMGGHIEASPREPHGLQIAFTLPVSREEEV